MTASHGSDLVLHDWPLDPVRLGILAELVGLRGLIAQGVGLGDGGPHRFWCPPSRRGLIDGEFVAEVGQVETEGGESCPG